MDTINLDELESKPRTVTLKGVAYQVQDMTVENFINFSKRTKELDAKREKNGGEFTVEDYVISMADTARMALRDVPAEIMRGLSVKQLTKLIEFLNGALDQPATPAAAAPAGDAPAPTTEGEATPKS